MDLGLPRQNLVLTLFGFNVGVEIGQTCVVALFVPLAFLARGTKVYRCGRARRRLGGDRRGGERVAGGARVRRADLLKGGRATGVGPAASKRHHEHRPLDRAGTRRVRLPRGRCDEAAEVEVAAREEPADGLGQRFLRGCDQGIGLAEVLGAVGLVLPMLLGIVPILTPIAAACLAVIMAGAVATHAKRKEPTVAPLRDHLLVAGIAAARFAGL